MANSPNVQDILQHGFQAVVLTSLAAVTATGTGASFALTSVHATYALQTVATGAPATLSCVLEGSLDGTNWVTLATSATTTQDIQWAVDKPVAFLRARLVTLTGGTAPTVTATILAA